LDIPRRVLTLMPGRFRARPGLAQVLKQEGIIE